ncbi:AMP-binding protein [Paenibacillus sp. GXUN7292]|uniref:AMP-binding protein n=1 Tax=Paenibacillus sp. GXUN7292 TaxID=3422499 RepID=UPI003D7CFEE6
MNFFDDIDCYEDSIAIITENSQSVSYRQLLDAADSLRAVLTERCLVFCFCENDLESVTGYLGFLRSKAVPLLLSPRLHLQLVDNLLDAYKPRYIWIKKNDTLTNYFSSEVVHEFESYVLLRTKYSESYKLHGDLALLLTSSGTTGSPKLIRQSYQNLQSNSESIAQYLNIKNTDKPITNLPMHYTYGLSIINSHLLKGSTIILTNKSLIDKAFWQLIKIHEVTTLSGVPYSYEILKKIRFESMNIPSLKVLTQAGGKLSLELTRYFSKLCEDKAIKFVVMYGQTEATARMSYLPSELVVSKLGSIGIAIPGGEFWIEDDNNVRVTEPDTIGELIFKGKNVTMGYASNYLDLCKDDENGGILRTGDIAKFDQDGFYYIVGRKQRFLKLFGLRINLDEVEQLLLSKGYNNACSGDDEKMLVYVVEPANTNEISTLITELIGVNKSGFKIVPITEIPRNESGKILYASLPH